MKNALGKALARVIRKDASTSKLSIPGVCQVIWVHVDLTTQVIVKLLHVVSHRI